MAAPILLPIITTAGFDPIWFAVVLTINMEIGLISPPVGLNLYVINGIAPDISLKTILKGSLVPWLAILALLSLAWSAIGVIHFPRATFYLLPARAWELLMGALLALWQRNRERQQSAALSRSLAETLSWLGFALVAYAITRFSTQTPFPGPTALAPCLGATLLIASNDQRLTLLGHVLAWKPMVFIGKISYSLYLWHWPIIVLAKGMAIGEISNTTKGALLGLSFLLASLSWRFVEQPFRQVNSGTPRRKVFKTFGIITAATILVGAAIYKLDGIEGRFSKETLQYVDASLRREPGDKADLLENGTPPLLRRRAPEARILPVLLWGDSHARALLELFHQTCSATGTNIYASAFAGTPPLLGVTHPPRLDSPAYNDAVLEFVRERKIRQVILAARWARYAHGDVTVNEVPKLKDSAEPSLSSEEAFRRSVTRTIRALEAAGATVWVFLQVPHQDVDPPYALANTARFASGNLQELDQLGVTTDDHLQFQAFPNSVFQELANERVRVLDPLPAFQTDSGRCRLAMDGHSLYHDTNHLSDQGSLQLRELFTPVFEAWQAMPED